MLELDEKELFGCCGSTQFAKEMAKASPFSSLDQAVSAARHVWFNLVYRFSSNSYFYLSLLTKFYYFQVDVNGWLEAFSAHPQIGQSPSSQFSFLPFLFPSLTFLLRSLLYLLCVFHLIVFCRWSKAEQSTALATATESSSQVRKHLIVKVKSFSYSITST